VYVGGYVDGRAYFAFVSTGSSRQWWLQKAPSTTVTSEVILISEFTDSSETYPRVLAVVIEQSTLTNAKAIVLMNMPKPTTIGPFTPAFLKITSGPYGVLEIKGRSKSETLLFV
jgi:phosphohistidine swiveling domain-containing protein